MSSMYSSSSSAHDATTDGGEYGTRGSTGGSSSIGGSQPDFAHQIEVDEAVLAKLPAGSKLLNASHHTSTSLINTTKLIVSAPNHSVSAYLLHTSAHEPGKTLMRGTFESHSAIHSILSTANFIPRPIAWGSLRSAPHVHYFLCTYHPATAAAPDAAALGAALAKLHTRSARPEARFGFPATTHLAGGAITNLRLVTDTWEEYFTASLRALLALEESTNGEDQELTTLSKELFALIIPRLLKPLESNGRRIRPALCHGNLTAANISATHGGGTMVFNPAAVFAHHEYDFAVWRGAAASQGARYLRAYLKHNPVSEPAADFDDRNALYALRFAIVRSIEFPGSRKYRGEVVREMGRLSEKFAPKVGEEVVFRRHVPLFSMSQEEYKGFHEEMNGTRMSSQRARQMSLAAGQGAGDGGAHTAKGRSGVGGIFSRR